MHVVLTNQGTGKVEATICIDRASHTCYVLFATDDRLEDAVSIAKAQKASEIRLIVNVEDVAYLESLGWRRAQHRVLMIRGEEKTTNGK